MASDRQLAANRRNARKSTGPASESGKQRSRGNALRHGLAIGADRDPLLRADVERLAQIISQARNESGVTVTDRHVALAEIDLLWIRKIRASIFEAFNKSAQSLANLNQLHEQLRKLDRYERRAFSRRRRALGSH